MMGSVGRADLARVLARLSAEVDVHAAELLGFEASAPPPPSTSGGLASGVAAVLEAPRVTAPAEVAALPRESVPVPFWRVEAAATDPATTAAVTAVAAPVQGLTSQDLDGHGRSLFAVPRASPLAPWARLWPTLRAMLQAEVAGCEPDVMALVRAWGDGEVLQKIPRVTRRVWTSRASVWIDHAERLVPFREDQKNVLRRLRKVFARGALDERQIAREEREAAVREAGAFVDVRCRNRARAVLVLGDLGVYGTSFERAAWSRTALRLRRSGVQVGALVPAPRARWQRGVTLAWSAAPWEQGRRMLKDGGAPGFWTARAERLLRVVSPAALVQPGLLRALRRLLPARETDAATEVDVWTHPEVRAADVTGLVLRVESAKRLREEFMREEFMREEGDAKFRDAVGRTIGRWHGALPPELIHAETLVWHAMLPDSVDGLPGDLQAAKGFIARLADSMRNGGEDATHEALRCYGRSFLEGIDAAIYDRVPALKFVLGASFKDVEGFQEPANVDLQVIYRELEAPGEPRAWSVRQVGDALVLTPSDGDAWPSQMGGAGSPVATLVAARSRVFVSRSRRERWMSAVGVDEYGRWAEVTVEGIVMRLRWIPPGSFVLGSRGSESGCLSDEVQREVELTAGYWLGETPVTQVLWTAVMKSSPSRFKGGERPVEQVNWEDCQEFIAAMNARVPELTLRLPTEAEWEYACRAGTVTETWVGDLAIDKVGRAPLLDGIAWYGSNSHGQTHPVRGKQANPYGLHDMLGNVWEWCSDWYTAYAAGAVRNAVGPVTGTRRVMRGASWHGPASYVRAGQRSALSPASRYDDLGFRLARDQPQTGTGKPGGLRSAVEPRGAGREPWHDEAHGPRVQHVLTHGLSVALRPGESVTLATDRTTVDVGAWSREPWVTAAGRDRYGLWVEASVKDVPLRFRWIPPGCAIVGAPENEVGRTGTEWPLHGVELTAGFWLGETPVTQELWQVVMKNNPSRFQSVKRPVERVSWHDCQGFILALNTLSPGLEVRLPWEVEWEYACRAGTTTATWAGDLVILGDNHAPVLDAIAWYGGNSGVGFDLANGVDSRGWSGKQYDHKQAGTHLVGRKQANPYGLQDMLGNVWEWCADRYDKHNATRLGGPATGAERVVRGGSYFNDARVVRAAYRLAFAPGIRGADLGLRLCRGSAQASAGR